MNDYQIAPPAPLETVNVNPESVKLANLTGKSLLLLTDNEKIFEDRTQKGCYINFVDNTDFIGMSPYRYYQMLRNVAQQTPDLPENYCREITIYGDKKGVVNFLQEGENTSSVLTWVESGRVHSLTIKSQNMVISQEVIKQLFESLEPLGQPTPLSAKDVFFRTPFSEILRMPVKEVLQASF